MQQGLKAKHELRLYELKKVANDFLEFTEKLTLLQALNVKALEVIQSVNALQQLLQQGLTEDELAMAFNASTAALFLDEIVDADPVGGLEEYVLSASEDIQNAEILLLVTEIMDRAEFKYNRLLEKVHAYNALLIG
ncbi:MAG: hypothetical protein NTX38_07180 [Methylobacter sp.]|nr:hypothetical protein [Methylobacter sp.]